MVKQAIQWVFWRWCLGRDFLIKTAEIKVKVFTAILLLITSILFLLDRYGVFDLPDFRQFSAFDSWFWALSLSIQAALQFWLLKCRRCLKCQVWSGFLLIPSGWSLLIVGGIFIAEYPPFNYLMVFYTLSGLAIGMAGVALNKRARQKLKGIGAYGKF